MSDSFVLHADLVPGRSVGPFELGRTVRDTLEYLRNNPYRYPTVDVKYSSAVRSAAPAAAHRMGTLFDEAAVAAAMDRPCRKQRSR